jgi:hypothetical protein
MRNPEKMSKVGRGFEKLATTLARSFERSGVFYIGILDEEVRHLQVAQVLQLELAKTGIPVEFCEWTLGFSLYDLGEQLEYIRASRQPKILLLWCLEHLSEPDLLSTLRNLNASREWLGQSCREGQISAPLVLLTHKSFYQKYLGRWAGDLLDGLQPPFELRLDVKV